MLQKTARLIKWGNITGNRKVPVKISKALNGAEKCVTCKDMDSLDDLL